MEPADYLRVLQRRWWLIVVAAVACALAAGGASLLQTPRYVATTRLLVGGSTAESGLDELVARQLAAQRAGAYSLLLGTAPAVAAVSTEAGVTGASPAVAATADGTSPFIVITVTANSPEAARTIANNYAPKIPAIVSGLEQRANIANVRITVLEPAGLPSAPSSPKPVRNTLIGLAVGLVLGLAAALLRETLDARLRDSSEIERLTDAPLLGTVPKEHSGEVLPSLSRPRSGRAEAYRHVRTNLEFTSTEGIPRSVVVTSPAPGEGKSSLAANLAVATARSGRSVVLVDADLRKPSIAKYFQIQSAIGLSDVLSGRWRWQEALVSVAAKDLYVLPGGAIPRFPSELLGSATMAALIEQLEQNFDVVIIDSPPVLPVSDALVIAVNVAGVIVVARMVETRRAALRRAVDSIRKVNATLLGVVGNAVVRQEEKAYGEGYGYAYGYTSDAPDDAAGPPPLAPATRRDQSARRTNGRHVRPGSRSPLEQTAIPGLTLPDDAPPAVIQLAAPPTEPIGWASQGPAPVPSEPRVPWQPGDRRGPGRR